jgi:hypothetical protein
VVGCFSRCGCSGYHRLTQCLDDVPGCDVPVAVVDDMELLVAFIVTGFGVGAVVDDPDRSLGVLELHLLVVTLVGNLLLAIPLVGRRSITARLLLLLLAKLFHELLDLSALLGAVVPRVVHRAPRPILVAVRGLAQSLIAAWVVVPPAATTIAAAEEVPASGLLLLLDFFFFLFLFLPLL